MILAKAAMMKALDAEAIRSGIPSRLLMERAASGLYECAAELLGSVLAKRIAVFCGSGNNGGDGFAFCRIAASRGAEVACYLTGNPDRMTPDTAYYAARYREDGGKVCRFDPQDAATQEFVLHAELIIDAMYGIGFRGSLQGSDREAARLINRSGAKVIAADLPSGAETDSGLCAEDCVIADRTVTFTCLKPVHCLQPAKSACGITTVYDIGIPANLLQRFLADRSENPIRLADESFLDAVIPRRKANTHKGDYGKVIVIGGCVGYTGAPFLAASAAYRTGSGLVAMAVPDRIYEIEAGRCAEVICLPFPSRDGKFAAAALDALAETAAKYDVCVLGPGMGRSEESDALICGLLHKLDIPVVLDADGINAAAGNIHVLTERAFRGASTVVTPHDVEFGRLGGDLARGRIAGASALAERLVAVVVLKGNTTVTAVPRGGITINTGGNPGMAKGGSGDLLAGVIASLAGQKIGLADAAAAGARIHAAAGDRAAARLGEYGMLPTDLLAEIPSVLKKYGGGG